MPNAQCPGAAVLMALLYLSLLPTPLATASDGLAAHLQVEATLTLALALAVTLTLALTLILTLTLTLTLAPQP